MAQFAHIGIIIKRPDERLTRALRSLLDYLTARGLSYSLDHSLVQAGYRLEDTLDRTALARRADLIVVVGGDGTLLHAARSVAEFDVPVMGVNIGRLGFLVDVSPEDIPRQMDAILAGDYLEERRALLHGEVFRDGERTGQGNALNDVVLHIRGAVRMIEFETRIDGHFVHLQRADGIVVCTPTGSTAYALSCGGPILHPSLNAMALVPVCPHTLSNRPIIVGGDSEVSIRLCPHSRTHAQVAFDGQANVDIEPDDRIVIRRGPHPLRLLHPRDYDYYDILRRKLRWSEHP